MTPKQIKFCEEYLIDLNATQAAIRAGYSQKTAYAIAIENLKKIEIQTYIAEKRKINQEKTQINAERVLAEYAKIAFANVKDFVNGGNDVLELKYLDDDKTAAVQSIDVSIGDSGTISKKLRLHDKVRALEALSKHLGLFEIDNKQKAIKIGVHLEEEYR